MLASLDSEVPLTLRCCCPVRLAPVVLTAFGVGAAAVKARFLFTAEEEAVVEVDDEKFIFLTEADVPGRETDGGGREMVLCKEWEVDVVPLVGETFPVGRAIPERMVLPGVVVGLHLPTVRVFEEVGERTLLLFWLRGGGGCAWDDDGGGNCSALGRFFGLASASFSFSLSPPVISWLRRLGGAPAAADG